MNAIFAAIFIISSILLAFIAPDKFLSALLAGGSNALKVAASLFAVYAVWLGLSAVAAACGLTDGLSRGLRPLTRRLFKTDNAAAQKDIAMNISCNLLGIGGAATPFAVKAVKELDKDGNAFAQKLLFVINATSIQILPTTVIALRASAGSASAFDIFLPSLICTAISTLTAVLLYLAVHRLWRR